MWAALVLVVFAAAIVELAFVSSVWSAAKTYPKGQMKLAIYFTQVSAVAGKGRCFLKQTVPLLCAAPGSRCLRCWLALFRVQLSSFAIVSKVEVSKVSEIVLSLLRMHPPSMEAAVGFCVLDDLTSTSKVALELTLQLCVALAMTIVYLCVPASLVARLLGWWEGLRLFVVRTLQPMLSCASAARRCWRHSNRAQGVGLGDPLVGDDCDRTPLTVSTRRHRDYATGSRGEAAGALVALASTPFRNSSASADAELGALDVPSTAPAGNSAAREAVVGLTVAAPTLATPPVHIRRTTKIVAAAVNFCLTAYSTLTVTAVKMLHCVPAPGASGASTTQRLFIRGTWECDLAGWQAPYVILVLLLGLTPAVLPFVAAWSRRPWEEPPAQPAQGDQLVGGNTPTSSPSSPVRSGWCSLSHDARLGVRQALVESYVDERYWWEAALMGQRLVRIIVTYW